MSADRSAGTTTVADDASGSTGADAGDGACRRPPARSGRRVWIFLALGLLGFGALVVMALSNSASKSADPNSTGSTGPVLASPSSTSAGHTIDGIQCLGAEQLRFHQHAHLAVFVDGEQRTVPESIGIVSGGTCLYWMHSHTPDGVVHIESPEIRTFTLGNYFDIWGQPLGPNRVGPAKGNVTAYVNGTLYTGNPRDIQLGEHVTVQLDVGKPVPYKDYKYLPGE